MINIFELTAGMTGTMLLKEKGYRDGSPSRRGRNDSLSKNSELIGPPVEDKLVTHESRGSLCKKCDGTPMKKLIEQEMSKQMETRSQSPCVVAKLMGLDPLPMQPHSGPVTQRVAPDGKSNRRYMVCEPIQDPYRQLKVSHGKMVTHDNQLFSSYANGKRDCRDVYEVSQHPPRSGHYRDEPFLKGRYGENHRDKRMDLVRQKFTEAKRLATNQKLIQSKEFQDALEVLSSNRDLFLKFLEEPNSLFSRYLHDVQSSPLSTQTRRITVLKPSKSLDMAMERDPKTGNHVFETNDQEMNMAGWGSTFLRRKPENLPQPTRIVVLKPSPGKPHSTKALTALPKVSLTIPQAENMSEAPGKTAARDSREVAKEITRQMRESFSSRRDETLLSSILSNGYTGDESSIYRSEDGQMDDEPGNFSDSEIATPTSRHSWDCVTTFGSPYSLSSYSRVSFSPEPSVIMEAKRRLSERWVMQSSSEIIQEEKEVQRSTSTLGEMLALSESKKHDEASTSNSAYRGGSYGGDQDMDALLLSCMPHDKFSDEKVGPEMPVNLQKSKSVPLSSSVYDTVRLDQEASTLTAQSSVRHEKKKSGKLSFKGKLSSFLFSRSKKLPSDKCLPSLKMDSVDRVQSGYNASTPSSLISIGGSTNDSDGVHVKTPYITTGVDELITETHTAKIHLSVEKPKPLESTSVNLGQPSPVSVLESPFDDDINSGSSQPCQSLNADCHRAISRSPPIESVARSVSWNGAYTEATIFNSSNRSTDILSVDIDEHERIMFVQMLLSSSGLCNETSGTVFAKWHSSESPLNPALLNKFLERKGEAAKCRVRRSNQRFLFDCVNAALLEISWNKEIDRCMNSTCCIRFPVNIPASNSVTDEVLKRLREWFSNMEKLAFSCAGNGSQLVDHIVRKELDGNGWAEMSGSEMGELGCEIERQVLEELVGEALEDFIGGCIGC